jgi:hypothetical protein
MPFTPVNDLPPNPHVRIFFIGQLILEPLIGAKGCEVYINRSASEHSFSIEVRGKRPNQPDEVLMRHSGPLQFAPAQDDLPPRHGMFIGIVDSPPDTQLNVTSYNGRIPSPEGEELDLALNMQSIHDVACGAVDSIAGRPSILIRRATFYTADTYPAGAKLQKRRPGSLPKPQSKFAAIIGANIYITGKERVELIWRSNGQPRQWLLETIPNYTYEIYINHEPLYQDDADPAHDEFQEFYKILPAIPDYEQFVLITPPPEPDRGSLRTPCMSVLLDQ